MISGELSQLPRFCFLLPPNTFESSKSSNKGGESLKSKICDKDKLKVASKLNWGSTDFLVCLVPGNILKQKYVKLENMRRQNSDWLRSNI